MVSRYRAEDQRKVQRQMDLIKIKDIKNQINLHKTAISELKQELNLLGSSLVIGKIGNRNMNLSLKKSNMKGGIFE
jgi:cell division protein FtsL